MNREELSFKFSEKYSSQIEKFENAIYDSAGAIGKTGVRWLKSASGEEIQEKINLCEICIRAFEDFKNYCYGKSKGGIYYFEDMWEHLHNSKCQDFSYIDSVLAQKEMLLEALSTK